MQPQAAVILGFRRGLVGGEVPAALCRPPRLFTWLASAAAAVLPLARPDCAAIFRADRIRGSDLPCRRRAGGPLRYARVSAEEAQVVFGVHNEVAAHYGQPED